jgi:hypothetical protein
MRYTRETCNYNAERHSTGEKDSWELGWFDVKVG